MPKFEVGDRIRLVAEKALWADGTESSVTVKAGTTGFVEEVEEAELEGYGLWVNWENTALGSLSRGWVDPALVNHEFETGDRIVLVDAQFSFDGGKTMNSHMGSSYGDYHRKRIGNHGTILGYDLDLAAEVCPQYLIRLDGDECGNGYYYDAVSFEPLRETVETLSTLDDLDVPTEEVNEIIVRIPTVQEIFTSFTSVNSEEGMKVSVGNPEVVTGFTLKRNDNGGVDLYLNDALFPYAIEQDGLCIEDRRDGYTIRLQIPVVLR